MKFLNMSSLNRKDQVGEKLIVNLGDYIQFVAIENLYKYMGLKPEEIVHLSSGELENYKGEKLIFPINYIFADHEFCPFINNGRIAISSDIIPVFLGISFKETFWEFTEERTAYLKKYAPIGCRDYNTYQHMQELGIESYIAGCITTTFPKRDENNKNYDTVFCVEAPEDVISYMPQRLRDKAEFLEHVVPFTKEQFYDSSYVMNYVKDRLKLYRTKAKMVVTSRLHCAIPCMAMGIPVILVKEYLGYPFDLLPKFLPFYTPDKYADIDWEAEPVELEDYKKTALECAKKRLLDVYEQKHYYKLHDEYSSLYKDGYVRNEISLEPFMSEMHNIYKSEDKFEYALWGISSVAERIYDYMQETYPNAKLVKVIDTFRKEKFKGICSEPPEVLSKDDRFFTIVTTINCAASAKHIFDKIGKSTKQYICASDPGIGRR